MTEKKKNSAACWASSHLFIQRDESHQNLFVCIVLYRLVLRELEKALRGLEAVLHELEFVPRELELSLRELELAQYWESWCTLLWAAVSANHSTIQSWCKLLEDLVHNTKSWRQCTVPDELDFNQTRLQVLSDSIWPTYAGNKRQE